MNNSEQIVKKLENALLGWKELRPGRVIIDINPSDIVKSFSAVHGQEGMRFIIVSGIDRRDGIELLYHFSDDASGAVISLRTIIADKGRPEIATVSNVLKGAEWIERELHELLGVVFTGHQNLKHLLLPDDWPEGRFPLRQDNNG